MCTGDVHSAQKGEKGLQASAARFATILGRHQRGERLDKEANKAKTNRNRGGEARKPDAQGGIWNEGSPFRGGQAISLPWDQTAANWYWRQADRVGKIETGEFGP